MGFVFKPLLLLFGGILLYVSAAMQEFGMVYVIPQLIVGWVGAMAFIRGFWEREKDKGKSKIQRKANRSARKRYKSKFSKRSLRENNRYFSMLPVIFLGFMLMSISYAPVVSADPSNYYLLTTTSDFNNGTKVNVTVSTEGYTDQLNDTLQLRFPYANEDAFLEAYYRMGDAVDEVWANNGTNNGASINTGYFGDGYTFATSDYIQITDDDSLSPNAGDWSISVWIKTSYKAANQAVWLHGTGTDSVEVKLTTTGVVRAYFRDGSIADRRDSASDISYDDWLHLVVTWEASTEDINIYINASTDQAGLVSGGDVSDINPASPAEIGYDASASRWPFEGQMDELKIFSRLLSPGDITTLYNSGNQYLLSGNWTSQNISSGDGLCSEYYTNITYGNASEGSYIDKVEWLQNDTAFAIYDENMTSGIYTNITQDDLTSGTFEDITGNYSIKVSLVGNGTSSVYVESIQGLGDPDGLIPPVNVTDDSEDHTPVTGGSGSSSHDYPFQDRFSMWLEANPIMVVVLILFVVAVIFMIGGNRK